MKKIVLCLLSLFLAAGLVAQEADTTQTKVAKKNIVTVTDKDDKTEVNVMDDRVVVNVNEKDDTVKIKLGNKGISITEDGDATKVEITDLDDSEKHIWGKKDKFCGHWAGYELGLNNFLNEEFKYPGSTPGMEFMDLDAGKSWNSNINFMQYSLPMARSIGWTTGLGFEWNNYYFSNNNSIGKDSTGYIIPVYPTEGITYSKTKLNTTYLTLPLLLEFQFGPKHKGFVSFGVIGGLKLHSNTKTKYTAGGTNEKNKLKDDLNLSPLRYAVTLRAGYKFIKVYANYGMVPLFKENTGPLVHPFSVGLVLISFR